MKFHPPPLKHFWIPVALRGRAWIEILYLDNVVLILPQVALRGRAWIEIAYAPHGILWQAESPSAGGRGLKFCKGQVTG